MTVYSAGSASIDISPEMRGFAEELRADLDRIDDDFVVNVRAQLNDRAAFDAEMAELTRDRTVNVDVDHDSVESAGRSMLGLSSSLASASVSAVGVGAAVAGIGGAAGLAGGAIGGLALGFVGLGAAATPALATIALGMDGIKEAAKTIQPQFDAMKATISQTFATTLTPMFEQLGQAMTALTPEMSTIAASISGVATGFVNVFTSAQGLQTLQPFLQGVSQMVTAMGSGVTNLATGLRSMLANLTPALSQIGQALGSVMSAIGSALGQLPTALFQQFADLLQHGVGPALYGVVQAFSQLATAVMPALTPLLASLGSTLNAIAPALGQLGAAFAQAITPLLPIIGQIVSQLADALAPILPVLSDALAAIGNTLNQILPSVAPVFQELVQAAGELLQAILPILPPLVQLAMAILQPLIGIIRQVVAALAPFIQQLVTALKPVIAALTPILQQVGQILGQAITQAIQQLTPVLMPMIQAFLQLVQAILPIVPPLVQIAAQYLPQMAQQFVIAAPLITNLIKLFTEFVTNVLVPLVVPVLKSVADGMRTGADVTRTFGSVFGDVMKGVSDAVKDAKNLVVDTWNDVVNFIKGLPGQIAAAAKGMWDGLKDAFRDTMNWIISGWNKIHVHVPGVNTHIPGVGKIGDFDFGLPHLDPLARGGQVVGPGSGTSDSIVGVDENGIPTSLVSNGEFVVNATQTEKYLPLLQAINGGVDGFADGGQVGGLQTADAINQFPRTEGLEGSPYVFGGVHWGDCSGAQSAIARFAVGLDPWAGRFATGSEGDSLQAMGFTIGTGSNGDLRISWYNGGPGGGHTAGTLPDGTNVEMGGQRGNGQVGGAAAGADNPEFTDHAYITPSAPAQSPNSGVNYGGGTPQQPNETNVPGTSASPTATPTASTAPTSWSDVAAAGASAFVKGEVSSLLGVFGVPDKVPPIITAVQNGQGQVFKHGSQNDPNLTKDPGVTGKGDENVAPGAPVQNPTPAAPTVIAPVVSTGDPVKDAVKAAFKGAGWDTGAEWDSTDWIVQHESGWDPTEVNPSSGAFGLFQFLGSTLQQYLPDRNPDPGVQGQAGRRYIGDRYGDPQAAQAFWQSHGWYHTGGEVEGVGDQAAILEGREFVVNAAAAQKNMPLLHAVNNGVDVTGGPRTVTNYNIKTARVEDAFLAAQRQTNRDRAAQLVNL